MADKFGISAEHRATLGYHLPAGSTASVKAYARDRLAYPVELLSDMLWHIRAGIFNPDAPRGQRRTDTADIDSSSDVVESSDSDSDDSHKVCAEDADDEQATESYTDAAAFEANAVVGFGHSYLLNTVTSKYHRVRADDASLTCCGRFLSSNFTTVVDDDEPFAGSSDRCLWCFADSLFE